METFNYHIHTIPTSISPQDTGFCLFILGLLILSVGILWIVMKACLSTGSQAAGPMDAKVYLALCSMFTPTSVAWPKSFTSLLKSCINPTPAYIEVDLIQAMNLICQGVIELRDPSDLSRLLRGTLELHGIPFKARIDKYWNIKTTIWVNFQSCHIKHFFCPKNNAPKEIQPLGTNSGSECMYFDLDCLQYLDLSKQVLRIKQQLRPGSSAILEFSCLTPEANILSFEFMASTVLFSPYISNKKTGKRKDRTVTPLFTKVHDIVALLSSGPAVIENITNVSREHARFLCAMERDLIDNKDIRQAHIAHVGMVGWREDRVILLWEANLLLSETLTRWRITLRK